MSKSSGPIFRKSVSGYNRNDVNAYIEQISLHFQKSEEELENKIRQLQKQLEEMTTRAKEAEERDFTEQAAVYDEKIRELETKVDDGSNIIAAKNEHIEKLQAELDKKDCELNKILLRISEMENAVISGNESIEKAKQYDILSRRLGDIMLKAGDAAEKIVADANEKAATLVSEAENKRAHCLEVLKKYTEKYCDKLSEVTVATAQDRLDRINSEMAEFEASLSRSVMNARKQNNSAKEYIDTLRNSLDESIDSILNTKESYSSNEGQTLADKMLDSSVNDIISQISRELETDDTSDLL